MNYSIVPVGKKNIYIYTLDCYVHKIMVIALTSDVIKQSTDSPLPYRKSISITQL